MAKPKKRRGIKPRVKDERSYELAVRSLIDRSITSPLLLELVTYDPQRTLDAINRLKELALADPNFGEQEAQAAITQIEAYQRARFQALVRTVSVNIDPFGVTANPALTAYLQEALTDNVSLIRKLTSDYGDKAYDDIASIIRSDLFNLEYQQRAIQEYLDLDGTGGKFVKNRARLITRDQNNKIVGQLNQMRHKQVGGRRYEWQTGEDARVRGNHQHLNGTVHEWDNPPIGGGTTPTERGNPGSGIQCRCVALFMFDNE